MIPNTNSQGLTPDEIARTTDARKQVSGVTIGGTALVADPTKTRVIIYKDGSTSTLYYDTNGIFCGEA